MSFTVQYDPREAAECIAANLMMALRRHPALRADTYFRLATVELDLLVERLPTTRPNPFEDPSEPERGCDACGKLYRGPAVYCSFRCAYTDA